MADIAKAYVQIIPSADGIKGSLTNMLGGEATSAGTMAGGAFAGGMSKALTAAKIGAGAVAATGMAVTAATGALVKGAAGVAQYGDNIDKMSQKMGISAEAYQEWDAIMQHSGTSIDALKPSFKTLAQQAQRGAEEFKALGISEEEVANLSQEDLFAKVITGLQQMEEGTERTAITSKLLGRGATELGALLNTSAEDTEAMRQKVHELGGVMSDEAVKSAAKFQDTLQDMSTGFDGLKRNMLSEFMPAVTTVMEGMTSIFTGDTDAGLEQLSAGITDLVGKITTVLPDFLNVAGEIIIALGEGLIQNLPQLMTAITDVVGRIAEMIIQNLPLLLQTGFEIIMTLANSIAESLPTLIPTIVEIILEMVDVLIENIPLLIDCALQLIQGLALGIIQALPVLMEKAPEIIRKLVDTLVNNLPLIIQTGVEMLMAVITGLLQNLPAIVSATIQIAGEVIKAFASINWIDVGIQIIQGIVNGIVQSAGKLAEAAMNAAKKAFEGAKNFLGIHSPSSLFRDEIGQYIDLGIAEGIEDYTNPITNAMGNLSDMSVGKFNAANQIRQGSATSGELALAGYGDITVPVYIGNQKFGQAVVNADQVNRYRSGGR